jgi:guanylate kinase
MSSEHGPTATSAGEHSLKEHGNLIVVSAPSGAGKSSLVERALNSLDRLRYSISCTTRQARGKEEHGVDYFYLNPEQFQAMCDRGEFLEFAKVHEFMYGTPRRHIEESLGEGFDVILDIDVQGAKQIRAQMPEAVTVFILPPSREALESRLRGRNLNEPPDLERRLRNASSEVRLYDEFQYVIINDDLERASAALEAIIIAERHRPGRQRAAAESIIATFGGESIHA